MIIDKGEEFKKMGIHYNIDNLKHVSKKITLEVFEHLIDRQLLRYIEVKYDHLEKVGDRKLKKKLEL